jgi:hypothetical protein
MPSNITQYGAYRWVQTPHTTTGVTYIGCVSDIDQPQLEAVQLDETNG